MHDHSLCNELQNIADKLRNRPKCRKSWHLAVAIYSKFGHLVRMIIWSFFGNQLSATDIVIAIALAAWLMREAWGALERAFDCRDVVNPNKA